MKLLEKVLMNVDVRLFVISALIVGVVLLSLGESSGLYGIGIFALWTGLMILIDRVKFYELCQQRGPINLEARNSYKNCLNIEKKEDLEVSQEELDALFNVECDLPWLEDLEDPTQIGRD